MKAREINYYDSLGGTNIGCLETLKYVPSFNSLHFLFQELSRRGTPRQEESTN